VLSGVWMCEKCLPVRDSGLAEGLRSAEREGTFEVQVTARPRRASRVECAVGRGRPLGGCLTTFSGKDAYCSIGCTDVRGTRGDATEAVASMLPTPARYPRLGLLPAQSAYAVSLDLA
jgi:hypothetical protein